MRLGISSWTVPWSIGVRGYPLPDSPLDAFGLLELAVEADVRVVQIADNLPLDQLTGDELDRLARAAAERALVLEVGTRSLDPADLVRYIEIAGRIGARSLRTVLSGPRREAGDVSAAVAAIQRVIPELHQHRVQLALENNEVFAAAHYAAIMRELSTPAVGVCLDTANSLGRPELLGAVLDQLADHTVMLHAKDYDVRRIDTRMGFSVTGAAAGQGRVDFDLVFDRLRAAGRQDLSVIIEHWPPFLGDVVSTVLNEREWLSQSAGFLRPLVEHSPRAGSSEPA
jgi:sugar phosphate isomerase/epimerase